MTNASAPPPSETPSASTSSTASTPGQESPDEQVARLQTRKPATTSEVVQQLLAVLQEGAPGPPPEQQWTAFLDPGGDSCLFRSLDRLAPEVAFRTHDDAADPAARRSIAAEVYHVAFAFRAFTTWLVRDDRKFDWGASFDVDRAFPAEGELADVHARWAALRRDLESGYASLRAAIEKHAMDDALNVATAIGSIAHLAYHLGAIRVRIRLATADA